MQITKKYTNVPPAMVYDELEESLARQDCIIDRQGSYKTPYKLPDGSEAIRGSLIARVKARTEIQKFLRTSTEEKEVEAIKARIIGTPTGETKLLLDIDEKLFPRGKIAAVEEDLDFMFKGYETGG